MLGEGTPLVNMTAVARRIKQTFGRQTMIYANFDASPFTPGVNGSVCAASHRCPAAPLPHSCCLTGGVPSEINAVSVDMYCGRVGHDGKVSPNSTCPDPTSEARHVLDYYRSVVYPLLQPHHRVFLVPGLFGANNDSRTDDILASKFESFWRLATKDPRVLGFKPWHFNSRAAKPGSTAYSNQFRLGAMSFPTLLAAMQEKGAALRAKAGPRLMTTDELAGKSKRRVVWWVTKGRGAAAGPSNAEFVSQHRDAVSGLAPCCNCWKINAGNNLSTDPLCNSSYFGSFRRQGLEVFPHGMPTEAATLSGDYSGAIAELAAHAKRNSWSGVHTDLEGLKSDANLRAYAHFVTNLSAAFEAQGMVVYADGARRMGDYKQKLPLGSPRFMTMQDAHAFSI